MSESVSATDVEYIYHDKETNTWIATEDAYIDKKLINDVKFSFSQPANITNNKNRRTTHEAKERAEEVGLKNNITYYGGGKVTYPDEQTSEVVYLADCVIQYRDTIKNVDSNYGKDYISVGVPKQYIDKMIKDAKDDGFTVKLKDNVRTESGCYWMSSNIEKLEKDRVNITFDNPDGSQGQATVNLAEIVGAMEQNVLANVGVIASIGKTFSADEKNTSGGPPYYVGIKLVEIDLRHETDITGPVIAAVEKRKKTSVERTGRFVAKGRLAELILGSNA
jgi:hypothetical protein